MTAEKKIWELLISKIGNPVGVAAIMGNLRAESTLNPLCITGRNAKQWEKRQYADAVNAGTYDRYSFCHDGIAFGLVQWCHYSRKEKLYDYIKANGLDIGTVEAQMEYLVEELSRYYKTVWSAVQGAVDITEATETVMLKYEKPGTTTDAAKKRRCEFAMGYYDKYAQKIAEEEKDIPKKRYVKTRIPSLIYRCGNGSDYSALGRILMEGSVYPWVATSENGWYAIELTNRVAWVSGSFSEVVEM